MLLIFLLFKLSCILWHVPTSIWACPCFLVQDILPSWEKTSRGEAFTFQFSYFCTSYPWPRSAFSTSPDSLQWGMVFRNQELRALGIIISRPFQRRIGMCVCVHAHMCMCPCYHEFKLKPPIQKSTSQGSSLLSPHSKFITPFSQSYNPSP